MIRQRNIPSKAKTHVLLKKVKSSGLQLTTFGGILFLLFSLCILLVLSPDYLFTSNWTKVKPLQRNEDLEGLLEAHKSALVYWGGKSTGWFVDSLCLQNKAKLLVYGVGCGEDISWDTSMVDVYNAHVYMFDPTEKSNKYTAPIVAEYAKKAYTEGKGTQLFHTSEGLSDIAGNLTFALPANPDHVSMRAPNLATRDMKNEVTVPVNTLHQWMTERHHTYLDILKIDIEGSEYAVLEDMIRSDFLPFTQLLVEYHDRFLADKSQHTALLLKLEKAGFAKLWSQNREQEVGYIKVADLAYCADGTSTRVEGSAKTLN